MQHQMAQIAEAGPVQRLGVGGHLVQQVPEGVHAGMDRAGITLMIREGGGYGRRGWDG